METESKNAIIEIPAHEITTANPYDRMVEMALGSDVGIEKLEKLLELKERHEANEARKAYHLAMSKFKADPPEIEKDGKVGYESKNTGATTSYNHATLGNVTQKINSSLGVHGLSASWKTDQGEAGQVKVTCIITHEQGYSEQTSLHAPPDSSGKKNNIQAIGSTVTYLQRYTILALTGLATKEQDNDGVTSEIKIDLKVKLSEEYKTLMKSKIDFPVEYGKMVETHKAEPTTIDECKVAMQTLNQLIDSTNK